MRVPRCGVYLLLLLAVAARAQTPEEVLKTYVGQSLLLREHGSQNETVKLKKENVGTYRGQCDDAVQVRGAQFAKGASEFKIEVIGFVVRIGASQLTCQHPSSETNKVVIEGFTGQESPSDLQAVIGQVLLTPEAYLTSYSVPLVPSIDDPETPLVPTPEPDGYSRPRLLLMVNPTYPADLRQSGIGGAVKINVIIGRDGRLYKPTIVTGTGTSFDQFLVRVLPFWRYEPARLKDAPVATRTTVGTSFTLRP